MPLSLGDLWAEICAVIQLLQGPRRMNLTRPRTVPPWQGSRVRPIWSHVHPNFSRVRLTKIPGRTGASSHSRKEKKSIRDSETLWLNKRHPR